MRIQNWVKGDHAMRLINEEHAAAYLGIATRTLQCWRLRGKIDKKGTPPPQAYQRGKYVWYLLEDLDEWIIGGAL